MFSLLLNSDCISESSEKCRCIPLFLAFLWECPLDRSRSRSEPTAQMRQAKPSPLDSCLARHIFSKQELVFIHEEI